MLADDTRSHIANVSLVFIEQDGVETRLYLSYFPDLVLQDFFLFDHINAILNGCSFQSVDDFSSEIQIILAFITKAVLLDIFAEWMQSLEQYCNINRNYVG
jgi:hypothetical protein